MTSTKTDLESNSFLSSLDMEPPGPGQLAGSLVSPGGSRVSLPSASNASSNSESIFAALTSPPSTGPNTGSSMADTISSRMAGGEKREVFSGLSRFVTTFGLRKDSTS
jgi:vacuolar protein sorting-associated protein 53